MSQRALVIISRQFCKLRVLSGKHMADKFIDDIYRLDILICDDSVTNNMVLSHLLASEGFSSIKTLTNPCQVVPTLEAGDFDLLMLDIEMPKLDGFAVMAQITESSVANRLIPVMVLTGREGDDVRNRALASGAQDFLHKPFDQTEVVLRVKSMLRVRQAYLSQLNLAHQLELRVAERTQELCTANDVLIERLAKAAELRDKETGRHVLRVGKYARVLADAYGMPQEIGYLIEKAAPLHDVGKIGIPDAILLKNGRLTPEERLQMEQHSQLGAALLADLDSPLMSMASSIALSHHERWDGSGYPKKLKGEAIPIEGRITALADVFDALTTVRPYKDAWPLEKALQLLENEKGAQFDPRLVELFIQNLNKVLEVKQKYAD